MSVDDAEMRAMSQRVDELVRKLSATCGGARTTDVTLALATLLWLVACTDTGQISDPTERSKMTDELVALAVETGEDYARACIEAKTVWITGTPADR